MRNRHASPMTRRTFLAASALAPWARADDPSRPPFEVGAFRPIYEAKSGGVGPSWHVNDHCFVRGDDGTWHMFGIAWTNPGERPEPALGFLEHATSPALTRPGWTRQPPALELRFDLGETVLWAPHVVRHDGLYHLFVCTGGPDLHDWGITRATSPDLRSWTRAPGGPAFRDGFQARDPMVFRPPGEDLWVVYYTATEQPRGGRHVVAYRTSPDLVRWSDRRIAYRDAHSGTDFGPTESPFVVARGGRFFLMIGPRPYDRPTPDRPNFLHPGYVGTDVFASPDWRHWDDSQKVGHIAAHAPELVQDADGSWHVSHCGVAQGGLHLAPFRWLD